MDFFAPQFRRNPNELVHSLYMGVGHGSTTVTRVVKPSMDRQRMETTRTYGTGGMRRGQGGRVGILILGGMETTLDEMEYILQAKQEKKFVPTHGPSDIAAMCKLVGERRNDQIIAQRNYFKKNPSEKPKPRRKTVRLHLPVGYRMVTTDEPGLSVLARI